MIVKYSYSKINTFKTCPQQYKIIYLDKIRSDYESIEAFMGKRVHEVLEWLYLKKNLKNDFVLFDVLMDKYKNLWDDNWHKDIFIASCKYNSQTISIDFYGPINCGDIILSPNLVDGINDVWAPYPLLDEDIEAIIFNRWGKEVFYHNKLASFLRWDGKSTDGEELPSYDYYYIIKFKNGNPDETGVITLIR